MVGESRCRKIAVGGSWSLTPQAQLAYSSVDFDAFTDPFGATVLLDSGDSLKGRIGMALNHDTGTGDSRSHVYAITNLTYEFLDGTAVDVAGVNVAFEPDAFSAELGLGFRSDAHPISRIVLCASERTHGDPAGRKRTGGFRVN